MKKFRFSVILLIVYTLKLHKMLVMCIIYLLSLYIYNKILTEKCTFTYL